MPDTTPAIEHIETLGLPHEVVRYGRAHSVEEAARLRDVELKRVIKSIVVRRSEGQYVIVLVPGDRVIDWKALRAHLGESRLSLAPAEEALDATGYEPGTITPLGSATALPVIADQAVEGLMSIGGGEHGVAINVEADDLLPALGAERAAVTKTAG
jgi:Cys-tRNA(Pro)/Cys-tRNA(Cys) deacylase